MPRRRSPKPKAQPRRPRHPAGEFERDSILQPKTQFYRARYHHIIGDSPVLPPGDHTGAQQFLDKIRQARTKGGWNRTEWSGLYKLERKWDKRAKGQDPHFEVYGNGRMKGELLEQVTRRSNRERDVVRAALGVREAVRKLKDENKD